MARRQRPGDKLLTLIIPVRGWPADRIEACIESFSRLKSRYLEEIVVVDFGSEQPIETPRTAGTKLVRVEAALWSLGEAINVGVLSTASPIIAKTDADILIDPTSLTAFDDSVERLASGAIDLAVSQAIDLHQSLSPSDALRALSEGGELPGLLRPKWGQGGLVFFTRESWRRIGGFDSRFTGWGNEDNDFAERMRRAGFQIEWTDREKLKIYHVWHPPTFAATGVLSQRMRNQKIAKEDKSVFRSIAFRHSNFPTLASPAVMRSIDPLVTLAIATTGREQRVRMVREAIDSFRGQIDNDFEIIVADNGSDEKSYRTLKSMLSKVKWPKSVSLARLEEGSIPAARNAISSLARGRYVCVVDDDDLALPNRLQDHLKVFERDGLVHGSHGGWIDFDETTGVIERNTGKERNIATLLRGSGKITAHPASFYRTDVLKAVPYDEAFALGSDFDLALRLANLGFEIAHTNTFVTLRRYHTTNVTITGQSNQVSNGVSARSRVHETFSWQAIDGLTELAKKNDGAAYCRNQMSLDVIVQRLPGYVGVWVLIVPVAAISAGRKERVAMSALTASHSAEEDLQQPISGEASSAGTVDRQILQSLTDLIPGDLATRRAGLNQEIIFRSDPIEGLNEALRCKGEAEKLLGAAVEILSFTQYQIDRESPFDWRSFAVKSGERALRSMRFPDLSDALLAMAPISRDTVLAKMISIISDYDEEGECYYLTTLPVRGIERVRTLQFELERRTGSPFVQFAGNGLVNDLVPNSRSH